MRHLCGGSASDAWVHGMIAWHPVQVSRYVATRNVVAILGIVLFVGELSFVGYGFTMQGAGYLTRWDVMGASPLVLGPLLTGVAAWLMRRNRFAMKDLFESSTTRANRADITTVVSLAAVAVLVHLAVLPLAAAAASVQAPFDLSPLWVVSALGAVGLLLIYLAIGVAAGALVPTSASPFLAGLCMLALPMVWIPLGLNRVLLMAGGANVDSPDLLFVPRGEITLAQLLAGVGLLGLVVALVLRRAIPVGRMCVGAVGGIIVLSACWFLQQTPDTRFWADDSPLAGSCSRDAPRICLPSDYATTADHVHKYMAALNAEARRLGIPRAEVSTVTAVSYGQLQRTSDRPDDSQRWMTVDDSVRRGAAPEVLANHLEQFVYPCKCFGPEGLVSSAWSESATVFRLYLGDIASSTAPDPAELGPIFRLSTSNRDNWLKAAWASVLDCSTPAALPTG